MLFLLLGHVVVCAVFDWVWLLCICSSSSEGVFVSESTQVSSRSFYVNSQSLSVWCNESHMSRHSWQIMWEAVSCLRWNHKDHTHAVCVLKREIQEGRGYFSFIIICNCVSFTVCVGVFFRNRESCVSAALWLNWEQHAAVVVSWQLTGYVRTQDVKYWRGSQQPF